MDNQTIAKIFFEIADMLEMQGVPWKPQAYRKAARTILSLSRELEDVYREKGEKGIDEIPGIGSRLTKKIVEMIETGKLKYYEKLKKQMPVKVEELMSVEGLGPKKIMLLYKKLGVKDLKSLEKAAREGKIAKLPRMGEKTEENILKAIAFLRKAGGRKLLSYALDLSNEIVSELKKNKDIERIQVCGSLARKKETIGDLDILVITKNNKAVMNYFTSLKGVSEVLSKGITRSTVIYHDMQVDLRVIKPESFGAAVQYFVGSKDHNIALRRVAISKGYKLNEYGLFKGSKRVAGDKEEEIYKILGFDWIPYELRENRGELEAASKHKLPKLVEIKDIKGDLQMHTKYSDGSNTVEEMVQEAIKLGHKYIAITDHVGQLAIAGSMSEKEIEKQKKEIEKVREKYPEIEVLHGAEVDIKLNGELAAPDRVLKKFDIVLGAIHSGLKRSKEEQTKRILKAMDKANIIAHPTGRILFQRPGYDLDFDKVYEKAVKTDTILEINAFPTRLDLNDVHIKDAIERGVKLSIGTDSHYKEQLRYYVLGVYMARRGWCEKKNIVNTMSYRSLINLVKR